MKSIFCFLLYHQKPGRATIWLFDPLNRESLFFRMDDSSQYGEVSLFPVHIESEDRSTATAKVAVLSTYRSGVLRLLDIGRGTFAGVSGGRLALGCAIDHVGEFFMRAIE